MSFHKVHRRLAKTAAVTCAGLVAGCALTAEEYGRYPSPDGERTVIVRTYADWIDPMYTVHLQHGSTTIEIGCVNGDYSGIDSITWLDNQTIRLGLSDGGDGVIPVLLHLREGAIETEGESDLLHSC